MASTAIPMEVPVLRGPTLLLRPHRMDDLDAVFERCVDPDTKRWTTIPLTYTRSDAVDYLTALLEPRDDMASWALEADGQYAGTIDLRPYATSEDHRSGDIGFVTHPGFRGRGLMSEAVALALTHGLDTLGWEAVQWKANAGNVASYKAAWRAGFPLPTEVEGLLIHRGRLTDGWISTMRRDSPRSPELEWDEVMDSLGLLEHPSARR